MDVAHFRFGVVNLISGGVVTAAMLFGPATVSIEVWCVILGPSHTICGTMSGNENIFASLRLGSKSVCNQEEIAVACRTDRGVSLQYPKLEVATTRCG